MWAQVESLIGMYLASDPDRPPSSWDILRRALHDGFQSIDRRPARMRVPGAEPLLTAGGQPTHGARTREVPRMKFRVEVICLDEDGVEGLMS
jgi:hypothetical protein